MEKPPEKKKTSPWNILIIVRIFFAFLILLALIFIIIVIFIKCSKSEVGHKAEIPLWGCTSLNCSLNVALDPCDDFYKFVCSRFINNTGKLPPEFSVKSQFNILWHRSHMELIALLNNQSLRQNAQRNNEKLSQQMFTFYDSCLDKHSRETNKSDGLFAHLRAAKFNPNKLHLFNTDWCRNAFPFLPFFNVESTWDVRPGTKTKSMFKLEPKRPLTNYRDLLNEERRQKFAMNLSKILHYLLEDDLAKGPNRLTFFRGGFSGEQYEVEIQRRVENFIQMEMRIGRAFEHYQGNYLERFVNFTRPEQYLSIRELINKFTPSIDWLAILRHFPQSFSDDLGYQSEMLLILGHDLLLEYAKIIQKTQREQPQMLSDYLDWNLIWRLLFELDGRFVELLDPWRKDELNCVRNFLRIYFKHWLDRLYMENVFDKSKIDGNKRILSYLNRAFSALLDEAKWMDQTSREKAKQKLAKLKDHIGYFRLLDDDKLLEKLYGNFCIQQGMAWAQMLGQVHRQFYLWPTLDYQASFWVDGFYKWVYNSLAIYGGIIHSPWFDPKYPPVMNFGAMGTFMGHEITHGFDSAGRYFDGQGNKLRPAEDLNKATMERMERAMQCFVQQYGQYEGEMLRRNARFTLAENIADNGAIRASHRAWMAFKAENPVELKQKPPIGLEQFNDEQLFFVSSAFMYCTSFLEKKDMERYAWNDNHAFPQARVNLPLRNFDAFARAFQCPIIAKMNPKKEKEKCRLW